MRPDRLQYAFRTTTPSPGRRDAHGRRRHPARLHRARPDLSPTDVP
ncbi:hypothetical protein [Streptomyces sp. AHA2]